MIKIFLVALIFNMELENWEVFDKLPMVEMPNIETCLRYQAGYNRTLVATHSMVRMFCVEKQPDTYMSE